jgi:signal transduction histidine kinase
LLVKLLESVNRAQSLGEIYKVAVDAVRDGLKADRAAILTYDETMVMRFRFSKGLSPEYRRAVDGHSPWKPGHVDPRAISVPDIEAANFEPHLQSAIVGEGIRALAFFPLTYEGRLLGKFMVYYDSPHDFTRDELRLGKAIAGPVAVAVERRQAAEVLAQAKAQLEEHAKNLEQAVVERTATLRETINELEAFSYSLSHDMRAPLRAMRSFSEILQNQHASELTPPAKELLTRIISASGRLDRLIQDVLTYSRIALTPIERSPIDLEKLLLQIIQEHPSFQAPQAEIEVISPILPVLGHEASLTQCVYNLLSNGVKFVQEGRLPRVRVCSEHQDGQVKIWFEDNGIGIPAEAQSRMFLMFQRFHPAGKYEGTGMGLTIVKRAAERMGGEVGVISEPGQGSRFWLSLPLASANVADNGTNRA